MAAPYELVIFDCDGVLVDSERLSIRVEAETFTALGWTLTEQDVIDRFVGRTHEYMINEVAGHIDRDLPIGWDDDLKDLIQSTFEAELEPVPGIITALDNLTTRTCVASSGTHDRMRFTLSRTGLYDRFEGRIYSAIEVLNGKPAPDLFLHAAQQMGVDPSHCAVIEDSAPGVEAALAAGMDAYAYSGGVTPADRLTRPGVTLFADMSDLPNLLDAPRPPHTRAAS